MAREYIDELGDGTINPETSGVDSQATDNGTHVKTLAPIYYTPATIANDGKATRETPVTIKSALEGKSNKNDGVYYVVGTYDYSNYSTSSTYTATTSSGPFTSANSCVYGGRAYFCKTAISTPEAWNSGHWTAIPTPVLTGTIDGVTELYAGLKIAYKFSITGGSSSTYLNINNLGNKYIRRNDGNLTTHIPYNSAAFLVFDGTYWRWADYDSDNIYAIHAACSTAAATQAKTATAVGYVLTAGETFLIRFSTANTYAGKLTLNVNSQGAKDIWINGSVSSASNYNIPSGIWWCHYDGTVYHIWTDGSVMFKELRLTTKLADDYIASATTWNAKQDALATQTAYSAKGTATKVPQITTNSLGQVTGITEVTISGVTPASHTHGNITNDGKVGTTADYAVVTTTGGAVTATSLATSSPSTSGNTLEFIDTVSQNSKGKISATKKKVTIDDTYSSTGTNPVSGKAIAAAIETLDVTEVGGDGKYIKKIKEDNGKITATVETMDTTPTDNSTNAVTSGGVKTELDNRIDRYDAVYNRNNAAGDGWVKLADVTFSNTKQVDKPFVWDVVISRCTISTSTEQLTLNVRYNLSGLPVVYFNRYYTVDRTSTHKFAVVTYAPGGVSSSANGKVELWAYLEKHWGSIGIREIAGSQSTALYGQKKVIANYYSYTDEGGTTKPVADLENYVQVIDSTNIQLASSSDVSTAITSAINALDVASAGGDGKYIKAISETDGKITATVETMDTTPTASSTKAVTSGGIKTALDGKQNTLATQTAYTSKGTSTKVPQITTNTLGQVTGITEVEISGVAPAPHEHEKLSYTAWANASLPNNTESGVLRRFYCSLPNYNFCVKLFDVTQFYDGTIVDNGTENSSFVGDVSFMRFGGGTLVGKSKVVSGIAYNSTWVRLYGDNKFCHPIILKDSREIISTWISGSYIPIGDVGSTVSLTPTSNSNLAYCVIDCSTYSSMYINSYSVTGAPTWAFIDSTNKILTRSSGIGANSTVEVPQGAVKLICNIKNNTECKTYCYVAIEAVSPKYYLALQTEGVTMSCYMLCEGRFYTRMAATNTIAARPLLTADYIMANLGASSPTLIPVGCSIQQNTIYNDIAGTLGTARKLAVSLSNTSTDTTFNGSADVTNIKVTGTLPVSNGGTGKTTVKAAEYNLLSNMGTDLSGAAIADSYRFVFAVVSQSETNGRLAGFRTASSVWNYIKGKLASDTNVDISGHADSATHDGNGNTISENAVYYVAGTTDYPAWQASHAYAINDYAISSGKAYYCKTAHTSGTSFDSSKWTAVATPVIKGTVSNVSALFAGMKIALKWPITGGSSSTYLNINNLGNVYIKRNNGENMTTHLGANTVSFLTYDGTYWQWADYNSNSTYNGMVTAYINNAGDAAKSATSTNFKLTDGITIILTNNAANTKAAALTLNVNSTGAKSLYINGNISSSTNYTIPIGTYFCHYKVVNGTGQWHLWTDGTAHFTKLHLDTSLPDAEIASAATWNAKQDAITYMTVAQENELISELGEL